MVTVKYEYEHKPSPISASRYGFITNRGTDVWNVAFRARCPMVRFGEWIWRDVRRRVEIAAGEAKDMLRSIRQAKKPRNKRKVVSYANMVVYDGKSNIGVEPDGSRKVKHSRASLD
jgi:hypothetical protein